MRIAFAVALITSVVAAPCMAQNNRANCIRLSEKISATVSEMNALRSTIEKERFDEAPNFIPGNIRDATVEVDDTRAKLGAALKAYVAAIGKLRVHLDFCAGQ